MSKLIILCSSPYNAIANGEENSCIDKIISIGELKEWIIKGDIIKHLFKYEEVQLNVYRVELIPKPLFVAVILRVLSKGNSFILDDLGIKKKVEIRFLLKIFLKQLGEFVKKYGLIKKIKAEVSSLKKGKNSPSIMCKKIDLDAFPVYLRTDLWFGVKSGGSVGHIAGVLNNLGSFTGKPIFISTDKIPTVSEDIEIHLVNPREEYWGFKELPTFYLNWHLYENCINKIKNKRTLFIYQRYSLNNFTGIKLAKYYHVPFILEYNGSEIWINRNWGNNLKYEDISLKIELLNLQYAELIVVVSKAMKDELIARGIEPEKILVNPNGVDPEKYNPGIDGTPVREKHILCNKTVIGFIGTFGKWHGAEVLTEAFGKLLDENPSYRESVRLLMIGDGIMMPQVKALMNKYSLHDLCILTGLIPQEDGPQYLAACDILASPHVPNSDGTPFFGSPTKLFEYMAMGKGIVASDLDQIGEVLEHKKTAWLVKPGNVDFLIEGLKVLIEDKKLRDKLGEKAREEVVAKYTWRQHTRNIIEKIIKVKDNSF